MPLGVVSSPDAIGARATSLGLDLPSFLRIVLTQLRYQDPLKPVDNFEFVSQLAQFAGLEQTRQLDDKVEQLLRLQSATQSIGILGKTVDLNTSAGSVSGIVQSISFRGDTPEVTVRTSDGQILANIAINQISQLR